MKTFVCLLLLLTGLACRPSEAQRMKPANMEPYIKETLLIKQGDLKGTFRLMAHSPRMNWYFCNLGLRPFVTVANKDMIRSYLDQYLLHASDQSGTIQDYLLDAKDEKKVTPATQDSDDSYVATFLMLAVLYRKVTNDTVWWKSHVTKMKLMANNSLKSVKGDSSGLIIAKPSWPRRYLMDNCEDYRGLMDFAGVLNADSDPDAAIYKGIAERIAKGISVHLFDRKANHFLVADMGDDSTFYPLRTAQIFPQLFDVPLGSAEETQKMYDAGWAFLNAGGDHWETEDVNDGSLGGYPWLLLGEVAAKRGNNSIAQAQLTYYFKILDVLNCPANLPSFVSIQEIGEVMRLQPKLNGH